MSIQPFTMGVHGLTWIVCLMEVSIKFHICTYCILLCIADMYMHLVFYHFITPIILFINSGDFFLWLCWYLVGWYISCIHSHSTYFLHNLSLHKLSPIKNSLQGHVCSNITTSVRLLYYHEHLQKEPVSNPFKIVLLLVYSIIHVTLFSSSLLMFAYM